MKIGCSTWSLGHEMGLEKKVKLLSQTGLRLIEINDTDFSPDGDVDWLADLLARKELKACSYHSGTDLDKTDPDGRRQAIEGLSKEIRLISALGGEILVVHPSDGKDPETAKRHTSEVVKAVLPLARELGVTLCLENLEHLKMNDLLWIMEQFDNPRLKFILDTGHLYTHDGGNEGLIKCVDLLKDYLYHIHAEDVDTEGGHRPVGSGFIEWGRLLKRLSVQGFSGCLMIEVHGEDFYQGVVESRDFLAEKLRGF